MGDAVMAEKYTADQQTLRQRLDELCSLAEEAEAMRTSYYDAVQGDMDLERAAVAVDRAAILSTRIMQKAIEVARLRRAMQVQAQKALRANKEQEAEA